ncbi:MAG: DUF554 domain-containing protein [Oscillospiraceae bacterium]|nr:DUF554 domain-containing protein [Oscillospiraceae bacterium]
MGITGAAINAGAIVLGGSVGLLLKGRIKKDFSKNLMRILGLCTIIIGISGALGGYEHIIPLVIILALGTFAGELLRIDDGLNKLGMFMQSKFSRDGDSSTFARGFVEPTLLFCVGALAILGSLESGVSGDRSIIFTKSIIDGVAAMMFASYLGVGVLFSAASVLIYQGSIEFFAGFFYNVFTPPLIMMISAAGGVMVLGIGLNMVVDSKIKIANFLPGFLFAAAYYYFFLR